MGLGGGGFGWNLGGGGVCEFWVKFGGGGFVSFG